MMFEDFKLWTLNVINVSFTTAVAAEWIDQGVAILAGITLIWMNVERAMSARNERRKD